MQRLIYLLFFIGPIVFSQNNESKLNSVNVFLGTSGDYGQLSPGASYPFSMLCLSPCTYPYNHTGYEYEADIFNGFTHTLLQGVGCKGSGGNILIKPILDDDIQTHLLKDSQQGSPGYYGVDFDNGIKAEFTVNHNFGMHHYSFPKKGQLYLDLSSAIQEAFIQADTKVVKDGIQGKIISKTTCSEGVSQFYFYIDFGEKSKIKKIDKYKYIVDFQSSEVFVKVGLSSVSTEYAKKRIDNNLSFTQVYEKAKAKWYELLSRVEIQDQDIEKVDLFYSLLYRTLQAPFLISEENGVYRTIQGNIEKADFKVYNGWSIWDNYREIFPLLSILYPDIYEDIVLSVANLYPNGKKNFTTLNEPSPSVRTEHSLVVLADAINKQIKLPIDKILPYLLQEVEQLDFSSPDKALESSYDLWALSEILAKSGFKSESDFYLKKALNYRQYWNKDFKDLSQSDVDNMQTRGLYQGTIWQYRWLVPYDINGLIGLIGSNKEFEKQLDTFFNGHYYNHANQPDLQTSNLYYTTKSSYKTQKLIHELLQGKTIQFYFNENLKGIDPYIGRIYKNQPKAFLRTMDDDLGTMSAWFVLRSLGISSACVGSDVFYLTAPIFKKVIMNLPQNRIIELTNENNLFYIESLAKDKEIYRKNFIRYKDLLKVKRLDYTTRVLPNLSWPEDQLWISNIKDDE